MYLARNEGNMCNVASDAWYPIVSATTTTIKTTTTTTKKPTTTRTTTTTTKKPTTTRTTTTTTKKPTTTTTTRAPFSVSLSNLAKLTSIIGRTFIDGTTIDITAMNSGVGVKIIIFFD